MAVDSTKDRWTPGNASFRGTTGKAGSGANVDELRTGGESCRESEECSEGIEEVLYLHFLILSDRGQIHPFIPSSQLSVVALELVELIDAQIQAKLGNPASQYVHGPYRITL